MWYERWRERVQFKVKKRWREWVINMDLLSALELQQQISTRQTFIFWWGWITLYVGAEEAEVAKNSWDRDGRVWHRSPLFCWIALPPSAGPGRSPWTSLSPTSLHCTLLIYWVIHWIAHYSCILSSLLVSHESTFAEITHRSMLGIRKTVFWWSACHHANSY